MRVGIMVTAFQAAESLKNRLEKSGHQVVVFSFASPQGGLRNRLQRTFCFYLAVNTLRGRFKPMAAFLSGLQKVYLNHPPDSPQTGEIIASYRPDVLVQKVGFILKDNILKSARLGVINDHIGELPFFRGRSVTEWTILHGKPPASTVHLIDRGVDTGAVLKVFPENLSGFTDFKTAKSHLFTKADDKIAEVIDHWEELTPQSQPEKAGKQFFAIHPLLFDYAEGLLKKQSGA